MTDNKRRLIQCTIDLDTYKLYGPLDKAIAYLQQIHNQNQDKKLFIDEHWTGYEDMELRFIYNRPETDEEYNGRLEIERRTLQRSQEVAAENARKKKILNEIERLKKQL